MVSRATRTPFGEWWWTVDKLMLGALATLMVGGIVLSLAGRSRSPPGCGSSRSTSLINTCCFCCRPSR
jgi:cell division protein FtsW